MTERLQEILNRKPSKWGNLTVKEFERDIKLLQERVRELEETNKKNYWIAADFKFENLQLEQQNKRYREAIEKIKNKVSQQLEGLDAEEEMERVIKLSELMSISIEALEREG